MGRCGMVGRGMAFDHAIRGHGWRTSVDVGDARHAFIVVFKGLLAPLFKQPFGLLRHGSSLRQAPVRAIPRRRTRSITSVGTQRLPVPGCRRRRRRWSHRSSWRRRPWWRLQLLFMQRYRGHQYFVVARRRWHGANRRGGGRLKRPLLAVTLAIVGGGDVIRPRPRRSWGLLRPLGLLWFTETAEQHV